MTDRAELHDRLHRMRLMVILEVAADGTWPGAAAPLPPACDALVLSADDGWTPDVAARWLANPLPAHGGPLLGVDVSSEDDDNTDDDGSLLDESRRDEAGRALALALRPDIVLEWAHVPPWSPPDDALLGWWCSGNTEVDGADEGQIDLALGLADPRVDFCLVSGGPRAVFEAVGIAGADTKPWFALVPDVDKATKALAAGARRLAFDWHPPVPKPLWRRDAPDPAADLAAIDALLRGV